MAGFWGKQDLMLSFGQLSEGNIRGGKEKCEDRHKGQCNGLKRMLLKFVWSGCWSGWRRWERCPQLGLDFLGQLLVPQDMRSSGVCEL